MTANRSREKRWVVIAEDGRFVTLGRASDPTDAEIQAAEDGLRSQGLAGWLAIMEGNPYVGALPQLLAVRPLAKEALQFSDVQAACLASIAKHRRLGRK